MEENNNTVGAATQEPKMISVEQANAQMQNVLQQANTKLQQMSMQVQQLDALLRDRTVEHLFKVVENSQYFTGEFVGKCTEALEKYLTQVALNTPEQQKEKEITPNEEIPTIE